MKRCACWYTMDGFLKLEKEKWLKTMERAMKQLHPDGGDAGFYKAWSNSFDVLQRELRLLAVETKNLHIIFEYCLPNHRPGSNKAAEENPIRADVILVSKDTVTVLEFKQKGEDVFIGDVRQARKYRNRIQDYHEGSVGMNKRALLVLTKADGFCKKYSKVTACSADLLAESLREIYGSATKRHPHIEAWIYSAFSVRGEDKE